MSRQLVESMVQFLKELQEICPDLNILPADDPWAGRTGYSIWFTNAKGQEIAINPCYKSSKSLTQIVPMTINRVVDCLDRGLPRLDKPLEKKVGFADYEEGIWYYAYIADLRLLPIEIKERLRQ